MKILITGASGFLGVRLKEFLKERHTVVAPTHEEMNICNYENVKACLCKERPDAVVHCAAISSTAYAQQHPEESFCTNVLGSQNVAKACLLTNSKLVYMSSDQVYGGITLMEPLKEDIMLTPNGIYGQHKLQAETLIQSQLPNAVGLRLTWMYDQPDSPLRLNQNILVNFQKAKDTGSTIKACTNELRGITDVWQVVANIEKALDLPGGIYNFGSENTLTTYQTYLQLAQQIALDSKLIIADSSWQRNLSMSIAKLRQHGIDFPNTTPFNTSSF